MNYPYIMILFIEVISPSAGEERLRSGREKLRAEKIEPGDLLDRPRTRNNEGHRPASSRFGSSRGGEATLETMRITSVVLIAVLSLVGTQALAQNQVLSPAASDSGLSLPKIAWPHPFIYGGLGLKGGGYAPMSGKVGGCRFTPEEMSSGRWRWQVKADHRAL